MKPSKLSLLAQRSILGLFLLIASVHTESALAQSRDPNKSRIRVAQDLERQGNHHGALTIYRNLYSLVPKNQLYFQGMKRNMLRLKMYDELIEILQSRLATNNDLRVQADLGNVYYKRGDHDSAVEHWNVILEQNANNKIVYPYVANAMVQNQLYDEAIEVYKLARKNLNQPHLFVFEMANIYALRLKYRDATLEYLDYLEKNPNQFNYIEGRIASYTKVKDHVFEVAEVLEKYLLQSKQKYLVRRLLANLYLRGEAFGQALEHYKVLEGLIKPEAGRELYFFAEKALRAGELAFANDAFNLIVSNYPQSPFKSQALYGLAVAKQKQGLAREALVDFENLVETKNQQLAQEALFQIGEIYFIDFFDLENALATYKFFIQKFSNSPKVTGAYFRIGDCYTAKGALNDALTWFQKGLNMKASERDRAYYKIAYTFFLQGDFEKAIEFLNKAVENMAQSHAEQNYVNDALELIFLIEENQNQFKDGLRAFAEGQKYKLQKKHDKAREQFQKTVHEYPKASIAQEAMLELAELENLGGNFLSAIGFFQRLLSEYPDSIHNALAQKRIAETYEMGLGDTSKAFEAYEKVLLNYPNSLYLEEVRQKLRQIHGSLP